MHCISNRNIKIQPALIIPLDAANVRGFTLMIIKHLRYTHLYTHTTVFLYKYSRNAI